MATAPEERCTWAPAGGTGAKALAVNAVGGHACINQCFFTASIIGSGPQINTSSMLLTGKKVSIRARTLSPLIKPCSKSTSWAWLDKMWIMVKRPAKRSFRSCRASLNMTVDMLRLPHQRELGFGLLFQSGGSNRQHRGDARTTGKANTVNSALLFTTKRPSGGITLSASPALTAVVAQLENRPFSTARIPTSISPFCARRLRAADGVVAAHILTVDGGTQRQKLARLKGKGSAQIGRDVKMATAQPLPG